MYLGFSLPRLPFKEDKVFGLLVLMLLSVPLLFYWGTYEKFETLKTCLMVLLSGIGLAAWGGQMRVQGGKPARLFWFLAAGLAASFFLSVAFTLDWTASLLGSYLRFSNGLVFFLAWLAALFMLVEKGKNPGMRLFFLKVVFFDALVIALVGILQTFGIGHYEGLNAPVLSRAPGLLGNPNFSAMFLSAAVGLAVPLFFSAKNLAGRLYYAFASFVMVWAVVLLSSRGAWVGLAAALSCLMAGLWLIRSLVRLRLAVFAIGALAAVFWLLFFQVMPRQGLIASTVSLKDENVSSRLLVWDVSLAAIRDRPLTGFGPGNYVLAYEKHRGEELDNQGIFDDPHNLFLQQAATSGLPYLFFFSGLLLFALIRGIVLIARTKDVFLLGVLSGLAALLVMAMFNPFTSANWLLLGLFLAILLGYGEDGSGIGAGLPRFFRISLRLVGAVLALYAVWFFAAESLFYQGAKAYAAGNFARAEKYLVLAGRLNPYQELSPSYTAAVFVRSGKSEKEILAMVEKIGNLHPKRSAAYALKSNLYYNWYFFSHEPARLDLAIRAMEQAVSMDPKFARRYGRLGYYYLLQNRIEPAIAAMRQELAAEPGYLPGWLLLAKAYQAEGNRAGVVDSLRQAVGASPNLPELSGLLKAAETASDIKLLIIPGGIAPDILE